MDIQNEGQDPGQLTGTEEKRGQKNSFAVPISIVVAGVLVSFAILYNGNSDTSLKKNTGAANVAGAGEEEMKPVDAQDHILGSPDASIKIVEYSDLECPFCKRFHVTMKQIMGEYGEGGKVAWVYRHMPLDSIHSKARKEAEATECAAKLGGNEAFWKYVDKIFEVTPSNNGLDLSKLPEIADQIGLDRGSFESCLNSGEFAGLVDASLKDAMNVGARGTPYSIMVAKNGEISIINGAQPYEAVKEMIESALTL